MKGFLVASAVAVAVFMSITAPSQLSFNVGFALGLAEMALFIALAQN